MRNSIRMMLSVIIMIIASVVSSAAFAGGFTDDHTDGTLTGWTQYGNRPWTESNDVAAPANNAGESGFLINNYNCSTNGTLEVRMTTDQWNGFNGGVVLRWTSMSSYYFVSVFPGNQYNNYIKFCKNSMDASTGTVVASNFQMGTTFTLKVIAENSTFKFYIDGVFKGQVTDTTCPSGKVGYAYSNSWNSYTTYDNVSWTDANSSYSLHVTKSGSGTVSPDSGTYSNGDTVRVTATAASGWRFDHWSGDASGTANTLAVIMNANKNITANFVRITYSLHVTKSGSGTVSPDSGVYSRGDSVRVTATAASGWRFDHWSGNASGSANPLTVIIDTNKNITANFVRITYSLHVTKSGSGTVSPDSGTYSSGDTVRVTATAASGWRFDHWSDDASGSMNPLTVAMNANKNITATFVQVQTYSLHVTKSGSGTVSPDSGVYSRGDTVRVTATAANGWKLDHWSGDASGNQNPLFLIMDTSKNVVANFVEDTSFVPNNKKISISARLYDEGTSIANDTVDLVVKLYNSAENGELKYSEQFAKSDNKGIIVADGYLVARLGEGTTSDNLKPILIENRNLWVAFIINGEELQPRVPLTASPYSLSTVQ